MLRKILSLFFKKPEGKLSWNKKDYYKGKMWAMTQPHPHDNKKTLWDYVKDNDSLLTIHELNKFL